MPQYFYTVKNAVTSTTADNEDVLIQLRGVPAASTVVMIKRIFVSCETPNDNRMQIRGYLTSSTSTGVVSTVALPKNAMWRASGASLFVKNGTTSTVLSGITATLFEADFNARGVWEWIARDELDYHVTYPSSYFTLTGLNSSASVTTDVTVEWID